MSLENKREFRFYVCLSFGAILMFCGFYCPPAGSIAESVLVGSGMFLVLGGLSVGLDIKGVIREYRLLKHDLFLDEQVIKKEEKASKNEQNEI